MATQPTRGGQGDGYGWRIHPITHTRRFHYGDDTLGPGNYAPVDGEVVFAGWDSTGTGLGWAVGIREADDPTVIWWVGHHGETRAVDPLRVAVGDVVEENVSYLGPKGSTGASAGPHAHTERRVGGAARPGSGTPTNPRDYYHPKETEYPVSITAAGRTKDGSIYVQFEPGCPFLPISSLPEWSAIASATGAKAADWADDSVLKKYGTSTDWAALAPSTHRAGGTSGGGLTIADVESAVRTVFSDAAS